MSGAPSVREFLTTPGYRVINEFGWHDDERRASEARGERYEAPSLSGVADSITNELVKSYGFEHTQDGWSWSSDRIVQSFKEEPFWTTVDYLTLAVPVAKWGTALRAVDKGTTVIGKAYQAGRFAERAPTSTAGKLVARFTDPARAAAAERSLYGPSRLPSLQSPITLAIDDEYIKWADEFGAKPWERRGIAQMYDRERRLMSAVLEKETEAAVTAWHRSGLTPERMQAGTRFLETGVEPTDASVLAELGVKGQNAYQKTFAFRNRIHNLAWEMGLISDETYARNLQTYSPRMYAEWEKLRRAGWSDSDALRHVVGGNTGKNRFRGRKAAEADPELTRILDPRAGVEAIGKAAQVIARQHYAQQLAGSAIAKSADELAPVVADIVRTGDVAKAKLYGIVPSGLRPGDDAIKAHLASLQDQFDTATKVGAFDPDIMLERAGWLRLDRLLAKGDVKNAMRGADGKLEGLPSYFDRLPDELKGRYLDPAAAKDVAGIMKWMYEEPNFLEKSYFTMLGLFKATKTAYNPATFVRNWLGNVVTTHMTNGGVPRFMPTRGWAAYMDDTADYKDFIQTGHASASSLAEVKDELRRAGAVWRTDRPATSLDFLGESPWAQWLQKGAGFAEHSYRAIDEIWKLDAWILKRDELMKGGMEKAAASDAATEAISKFMPSFVTNSKIGDQLRTVIPFASFTNEALRVWKNALAEKPHIAFFWNHIAETMSATFGAMAGFSQEELDNATGALPAYMNNKKLLALPFRVDDRPMFLDLSYVIPLGNLVEAEQGRRMFFQELYDPGSNPVLGMAAVATTGVDPFTQRPVEPRFTERQLGVPVESASMRRLVGLGEYTMRMFTPPLAPWGYAGVNLLEAARGQVDPNTGADLERSIAQTVTANLIGMRTYQPDVSSQIQNVRHEQAERNERIGQEWGRYEWALANGDPSQMERSRKRLLSMKLQDGTPPADAEDWFAKGVMNHRPGSMSGLSTKQVEDVLLRTNRIGATLTDDERRLQSELLSRYHGRGRRKGTEREK